MDRFTLFVAGVYVYGATALAGLIAAGISIDARWCVVLAIGAAGCAWCGQNELANGRSPLTGFASLLLGVASAIAYLMGV